MARRLFAALAVMIFAIISPVQTAFAQGADTASGLQGGICVYKCGGDIQGFIDGYLTEKAGLGGEWYIMTFAQSGEKYDFSRYERALLEYLKNNKVASATSREKYALTLVAIGSEDSYICEALQNSAGQQGLMSLIFGLHIANNGCTAGDITADSLIADILALQLSDGGFAIIGQNGDPDCTAMTLTSLAPYYNKNSKVKAACDKALKFLSSAQTDSGAFKSFGKENCESTAQVLLALSSLGIDGDSDSRFVKNGHSLLDGLSMFALPDGSFEHAKGEGANESAVTQAFYSLAAYVRYSQGRGALFVFDNAKPQTLTTPEKPSVTTKAVTTRPAATASETAKAKTTTKASVSSAGGGAVTSSAAAQGSSNASTTTKRSAASSGGSLTESGSESVTEAPAADGAGETDTATTTTTAAAPAEAETAPSQTSDDDSSLSEQAPAEEQGGSIKLYIYAGLGAAVLISGVLLIIRGKRNVKSFVFIIAIGGVLCAVTALLDIETKEEHFAPTESVTQSESAGQATMSIDCLTIVGQGENIPESGWLLEAQDYDITEGETAFDLLERVARSKGIILDIKGSDEMIYVAGIAGIYEYDHGELSGWMYYVNGKAPSVNSSQYILKDGDRVEWRYTTEIGHDLDGEDEYFNN